MRSFLCPSPHVIWSIIIACPLWVLDTAVGLLHLVSQEQLHDPFPIRVMESSRVVQGGIKSFQNPCHEGFFNMQS